MEDDETYYRYMKYGLVAPPRSVVLFQFKAQVIASAEFVKRTRFRTPETYEIGGTTLTFNGVFIFRVPTICVFDPWDTDDMRRCWPDFPRFNNIKQFLDPNGFDCFIRHCRNVRHA